jgi:hypothetical protein
MKTVIVLLLSCVPLFAGETIIPLKSGETTNFVSYGLFCLVSDSSDASDAPPGENLVLALRNEGAKWISLDNVTVEDFSLRDAEGHEMKIYLRTPPKGMGSGEPTIIHLEGRNAGKATQPWTLHFKSKPGEHNDPLELTITGIKPHKR